ncbi:MAG: DUF2892 domain-containing protein [Isosphaeraceae bacterium]|nr:DUF2892 domain-containing protein [Isosphaeraceae bacterium]
MATILTTGRAAEHIRAQDEAEGYASNVNVGDAERMVSGIGGVALVAGGLARGGWTGAALALAGGALIYRGVTGQSPLYANLGTTTAGKRRGGESRRSVHRGVLVRGSCTVSRTPEDCYAFCRAITNLPKFMDHVQAIQKIDETHSRWFIRTPIGTTFIAECEIFNDVPGRLIAWRSVEGADVRSAGSTRLQPAPGNRGTEVTVEYNYEPLGGLFGVSAAKLLGHSPDQRMREDLRRFKQIMEAGEIATVQGQTSCRSHA